MSIAKKPPSKRRIPARTRLTVDPARLALAAFRRRRQEVVDLLDTLSPEQWQRGGIHLRRGRLTLDEWVGSLAAHDDNHLDQMRRALEGRP